MIIIILYIIFNTWIVFFLPFFRAHLTTMLPAFRSASSEEDLLSPTPTTVGGSLEPECASPTQYKSFSLTDVKLDTTSSTNTNNASCRSNLRHLTKNRAILPHNRRAPSRHPAHANS